MLAKKSIKLRLNLRKRHYQLTFIFYQMIRIMFNSPYNNDVVFDSALQLCSLYNDAVSCAMQFHASSGAQVCSRFFPPLLITPKKLDISTILQVSQINWKSRQREKEEKKNLEKMRKKKHLGENNFKVKKIKFLKFRQKKLSQKNCWGKNIRRPIKCLVRNKNKKFWPKN